MNKAYSSSSPQAVPKRFQALPTLEECIRLFRIPWRRTSEPYPSLPRVSRYQLSEGTTKLGSEPGEKTIVRSRTWTA